MGVVVGEIMAFGRRTQGVRTRAPQTTGGELSGYQALKPPQVHIDETKSLEYKTFHSS